MITAKAATMMTIMTFGFVLTLTPFSSFSA
jgi:hypothetical protein